uniref:Uncharacterized protein n=1 Tax=Tetraselmis sp. GSL018 TaxID=582737 RepID=A0A061SCV5_9CHLO|mmetsp:Transcript_9480/g.22832  ORF Transcript_9480/g.22832 Transcript_9480/m.22832 type:complete len:172 (-) Transcript_9480:122-637(-)|eukprot:CAMPEP_0177594308 /NCGR_PEP_ID=MMETSP0419_2-20121207/9712_1 /TAXON_ID=582737 /ORGANISM="Tetraselmis sp., Strain GSL018" /LENGTH=171 /DNA_ID=CAMNT_0019085609 /DNA_START=92 /DNA_END=607 /DNA_ORIENTATION=-
MEETKPLVQDPSTWKVQRIYDDGKDSYWDEIDFPLYPSGKIGSLSQKLKSDGIYLRWTPGTYDWKWHNAPQRQLIVCLNSETEVTSTKGERRVFGPGDCFLVDDTRGRGHCSKCLNGEGRWSIFITLPDEGRPAGGLRDAAARLIARPWVAFAAGVFAGAAGVMLASALVS